MKKPRRLRSIMIKGQKIKIVRRNLGDPERIVHGEYDPSIKTITLSKTIKDEILQVTFFHEFIHAVLDELHISQQLPNELEEIIADNIATALVKCMRNELMRYEL